VLIKIKGETRLTGIELMKKEPQCDPPKRILNNKLGLNLGL
jgi:hypothetical protein